MGHIDIKGFSMSLIPYDILIIRMGRLDCRVWYLSLDQMRRWELTFSALVGGSRKETRQK